MLLERDVLAAFPAEVHVPASTVADAVTATSGEVPRVLVVLDDDPTGTQSVADLPVLTRWEVADFAWAFQHVASSGCKPAVYVLTNTRSLDPAEAAARNAEVVRNALAAAGAAEDGAESSAGNGQVRPRLGFVSRGDSTLRGHYPLEPDVIAATVAEVSGEQTDGVVLVPAFPDAGRVTIGGKHYVRGTGTSSGSLIPVAETEFARDATFGYTSSDLAHYVEEKSRGRFPAESVITLDLDVIRAASRDGGGGDPCVSATAIADALESASGSTPIVVDVVCEDDLRLLALGLEESERRGKKLLYRVGPPFVRARIGQEVRAPLTSEEAYAGTSPSEAGGLIVVGSHVGLTTRQLKVLTEQHRSARVLEIDVERLLEAADPGNFLDQLVTDVVEGLRTGDVIVHTSRLLVRTGDPAASLRIARTVSAAVVALVNKTLKAFPPRFVIAKGGITSSDVAAYGLEIRHAIVRGPMLPGIVSLWEPVDGPARGIPYVVFAGNVGDDDSLAQVTRKLSTSF